MARGGRRPGAGRPKGAKLTKALYVPMEPDDLERYHRIAAHLGEPLAGLVRQVLQEWADAYEATGGKT